MKYLVEYNEFLFHTKLGRGLVAGFFGGFLTLVFSQNYWGILLLGFVFLILSVIFTFHPEIKKKVK